MYPDIAAESLIQRGRSPFYSSLISVYQKALDALYELQNPSVKIVIETLESINFTTTLKNTILKYTKLPVSAVMVYPSKDVNMFCSVMFTNNEKTKKQLQSISVAAVLAEITQLYDDRTGMTSKQVSGDDTPIHFQVAMFAGNFIMRNPDKSFFISAEELAAGTLHEVGHIDYYMRMFLKAQAGLVDASDIVTYLQGIPDKQVVLTLIDSLLNNKRVRSNWNKPLQSIRTAVEKSINEPDPITVELLSAISTIVCEDISNRMLGLFGQMEGYGKLRPDISAYIVDNERTADEYAVRNGAFVALTSFLKKLGEFSGPNAFQYYHSVMGIGIGTVFALMSKFDYLFDISPESISNGYDPLIRRLQLIVETAKHAFSDPNLPPSAQTALKAEIAEAEIYLRNYSDASYRKSRLLMKTWRNNMAKFGRVLISPFHERFTEYNSRVHEATRSLSRNPLYYLANK